MRDDRTYCVMCAWRERCQKKYSRRPESSCLDYSEDISLRPKNDPPEEKKSTSPGKAQ